MDSNQSNNTSDNTSSYNTRTRRRNNSNDQESNLTNLTNLTSLKSLNSIYNKENKENERFKYVSEYDYINDNYRKLIKHDSNNNNNYYFAYGNHYQYKLTSKYHHNYNEMDYQIQRNSYHSKNSKFRQSLSREESDDMDYNTYEDYSLDINEIDEIVGVNDSYRSEEIDYSYYPSPETSIKNYNESNENNKNNESNENNILCAGNYFGDKLDNQRSEILKIRKLKSTPQLIAEDGVKSCNGLYGRELNSFSDGSKGYRTLDYNYYNRLNLSLNNISNYRSCTVEDGNPEDAVSIRNPGRPVSRLIANHSLHQQEFAQELSRASGLQLQNKLPEKPSLLSWIPEIPLDSAASSSSCSSRGSCATTTTRAERFSLWQNAVAYRRALAAEHRF
ncbi:uncharacterized protein ASCRUDRAFT_71688 [Ascoidea rubescens DSM 1968]|uniref:Uncharacterized protein n=1 Tax=Ascoidea rubescens DSM 1968 TaxID=1344418 RepID=A0A1D2VCC1_9ASCO|nr:hypothetical protein ASCRUDRAFT_71688 [Ascoidea rubescens DSM 1968]ODV59328.1 hypothetical protein ASCRUDRAFT_71688 [Ascoidea rubescens DSM 1968]